MHKNISQSTFSRQFVGSLLGYSLVSWPCIFFFKWGCSLQKKTHQLLKHFAARWCSRPLKHTPLQRACDGERDREEFYLSPVNIILGHGLERRKSKKEYFPFKTGKAYHVSFIPCKLLVRAGMFPGSCPLDWTLFRCR